MIPALIESTLLVIVYTALLFYRWNSVSRNGVFDRTLLYLSLCLIIFFTLFPMSVSMDTAGRFNFIPYIDWYMGYGDYAMETLLNILLFIPFAISARRIGWSLKRTIMTGLVLSALIEISQPILTAYRICDITDIINNTTGTLAGCLIFHIYMKMSRKD